MDQQDPNQNPDPDQKSGPNTTSIDEMSRAERKRLKRQQAKEERKEGKAKESKKSLLTKGIIAICGLLLVSAIAFLIFSGNANANSMDDFAKCMEAKGAVIYGNNWCKYTSKQKAMFGGSFQYLNYVVCDQQKALCDEKKITITPTWEIDGKMYREVQQLDTLSQLTGCKL